MCLPGNGAHKLRAARHFPPTRKKKGGSQKKEVSLQVLVLVGSAMRSSADKSKVLIP